MVLSTIILSFTIICLALYLYFHTKLHFFQKFGIPQWKPWPILGNMAPIMLSQMSLPQVLSNFYNSRSQAKYFGFYEFTNPVVVICDPELVKSIGIKNVQTFTNRRGFAKKDQDPIFGLELFSIKDEKWHQTRNLLTPIFSSSKMKSKFKIISQQAEKFVHHVSKNKPVEVQIQKLLQKLIIDIMSACIYGISSNCVTGQENDLYVLGPRAVNLETMQRNKYFLLNFPILWKTFRMTFLDKDVVDYFRSIVATTISKKTESKTKTNGSSLPNMIDLMMEGAKNNKSMSNEEMTAQVYVFFMASFDTTSRALTHLFYDLAVNPQVQDKLQQEIDNLQKEFKKKSTNGNTNHSDDLYTDIKNLKFLDAVLKESLRVHTLVPIIERACSRDFTLPPALPGSKSFTLKSGTLVWIPAQSIHEDPNYYSDPKKFDPDRFVSEKIAFNSSTYMPFGIGPRGCIAYRFALLIIKVIVFNFFARCSIRVCSKTPIPLDMVNKNITNTPKNEIWLQIKKREI